MVSFSHRAALCLVLVDGADDVIRVAKVLQEDFVELTLLLRLQRALLTNTHTQKYTQLNPQLSHTSWTHTQ